MIKYKHRRGVPYWKAAVPRRWHICRAQTVGRLDKLTVYLCACGASRNALWKRWAHRNTRRGSWK
jgi:hypothetical protein